MKNLRVAVAGMGRSGLAIAESAKKRGALPTVYDEQAVESPAQIQAVEHLDAFGIPSVTSWHGHLDPDEFDLLVASPGFGHTHPAITDALAAKKEVISEVEFAYRIAKSPMICITGTNGKSTTTVMTWLALKGAGLNAVLCGNISGSGYDELTLTEAADRSGPNDVLVAEISSFQLEWVQSFKPRVATITNITPDHLDRYPDFEQYFSTKLRLFENLDATDTVVMNLDDQSLQPSAILKILPKGVRRSLFSFHPSHTRDLYGNLNVFQEGDHLNVFGHKVSLTDFPFKTRYQLTNAAQALSLACAFLERPSKKQIGSMFESLKSFKGLSHRMEVVGEREGVLVINNSMCTNPMAVVTSSQSLKDKQHLLMGGNPKNLDFFEVKNYLESSKHKVYVFGPDAADFNQKLGGFYPTYSSLEEAFEQAVSNAVAGEVVMLAPGCASSFPFANFRERGEAFCQMATDWIDKNTLSTDVV